MQDKHATEPLIRTFAPCLHGMFKARTPQSRHRSPIPLVRHDAAHRLRYRVQVAMTTLPAGNVGRVAEPSPPSRSDSHVVFASCVAMRSLSSAKIPVSLLS